MMRILVLGNTGQVGWEAQRALAPLGEVIGLDYPDVDFTRPERLSRQVIDLNPQVIYNAVAYTAVDKAESEPERVRVINAASVGVLAEAAARLKAVLIHFSTDYVFDGKKDNPYLETDEPSPLNVYGQTKLEGERAVQRVDGAYLVLRTAWVYSSRRDSFVNKVLQWSKDRDSIRVVQDQISNPTWARMLAEITAQALAMGRGELFDFIKERRGIYHLAGSGIASRMEWAQEIVRIHPPDGHSVEILPALSSEFPTPANRPLYSAMDCSQFTRVFGLRLPDWQQALRLAMEE
jgi:dTDP-4-dehydrorhamnose reductase